MSKEETKTRKTIVKVVSVIKDGKAAKTVAIHKIRDMEHTGFIDPNEDPKVGLEKPRKATKKSASKKKGK